MKKADKTEPAAEGLTTLCGEVQRITFHAPQSGFTIAQIQVEGDRGLLTAAGDLMAPAPGTLLQLEGYWTEHPHYGRQFRVTRFQSRLPTDERQMRKYLAAGLLKGIGPVTADLLVDHFGAQTLTILADHPERLTEVPGIGRKRQARISAAWQAQNHIAQVMLFLHGHDIGPALANKIFKYYGRQTITQVRANPYRLAYDIEGIGFLTADRIARRLGFDPASPLRIAAGGLHALRELTDEGHVYALRDQLINRAMPLLQSEETALIKAVDDLAGAKKIILEPPDRTDDQAVAAPAVFPTPLYQCEVWITKRLQILMTTPSHRPAQETSTALAWAQRRLALDIAAAQVKAISLALTNKVLVITGGPGTGKTTIIRAITELSARHGTTTLLAAPTGRAAKRLSQATGRPAKTIHRLLEYNPVQGSFQRDQNQPLEVDLLIVDEASMIDLVLMDRLLRAVPAHAALILVGDVDQLPSVGPGQVLKDIIASGAVPTVVLDHIFRQVSGSGIVVNAHRINAGRMPVSSTADGALGDFYFIEQDAADKVAQTIVTLTSERIPRRFGLDPIDDIQVLTPMYRGVVGAESLNRRLQAELNPQAVYVGQGDQQLRLADKVMQIRNNYDKEVFNGDVGRIRHIDARQKKVRIHFDERTIDYDFSELHEIVLAYAVSVHKAQGSEYPAVIIPVALQHYLLLQRNLIYTAITRARRLTVLVGSKKALAIAVHNQEAQHRNTRLARRLLDSSSAPNL